jgi:hypothetical protein
LYGDYEPTLVPSGSGFNATFDSSKCVVADRVEHHVPVFKEDVSFAFGMPAGVPASDADPAPELVPVVDVPAFDADSAPVPVIDVDAIDETHHIESSSDVPQDLADFVVHTPAEMLEDPVVETPHELMLEFHRNYDQNHPEEASHDHPQPSPDDEHVDLEPKESKIPPKHGFVPFDHPVRVLVTSLGFEAVDGHPSVFFQHETKLLVVVYVDDILASGPKHAQDQFWPALRKEVQLDDVEGLSQFLGRFHHLSPGSCVLDMRDYSREAVNLYLRIVGKSTKLRTVTTPFVSEGSLIDSDYQTTGEISDKASSILMKILWLRSALSDSCLSSPALNTFSQKGVGHQHLMRGHPRTEVAFLGMHFLAALVESPTAAAPFAVLFSCESWTFHCPCFCKLV